MKVLLKVPLSPYLGYGNDGIGIARAFMDLGADVYLHPTTVQAPLPADVAQLLTKPLQAPFDLSITHLDPGQLEASPEQSRSTGINVGWTMWEYSNFGNLSGRSKLKKNLKNFDVLVGYDEVTVECFQPYFKGSTLKVQGGFWPEDWQPMKRDWHEENFYFFMIGELTERKNPWLAVQAFSELKNEHADFDAHARLSLKTTRPGLHSKMEDVYPGLRIYYDMWPTETVKKFYESQHVLLAPSRGEGKNMPALEFMSTGGTVIATNWGGHKEWLSPEYAYPLDYEMKPIKKGSTTENASASLEHLKELMLHVFRNRDEAEHKGEVAARTIPTMMNWPHAVERLLLALREVPGGEKLWTLASIASQESRNGNR